MQDQIHSCFKQDCVEVFCIEVNQIPASRDKN